METLTPLALGSIGLAGILSVFSPCIFPLLPVYVGILTGQVGGDDRPAGAKFRPLLRVTLFMLGISTVFLLLGVGASYAGKWLQHPYLPVILGSLVILMGFQQLELVSLPFLAQQRTLTVKPSRLKGYLGPYLLGLAFSFSWTPCIGPVLSAILALSLRGGQGLYGGVLMGVYSLGMALPFLVLSFLSHLLMRRLKGLRPYLNLLQKVGGVLIVLMGVALIFDQVNFLTGLFTIGR